MKLKVDLYTKIVLTLIAVGLFANVAKNMDFITQVKAAEVPTNTRVMLPNTEGVIDVNIVQVDGKSVGENHIPVMVKNDGYREMIPIEIRDIISTTLPVEVKNSSLDVKVTNFP